MRLGKDDMLRLAISPSGKESVTCSGEARANSLVSNWRHDVSLDDSVPDDIRQAPDNKERALANVRNIDVRKVTNKLFDF